jgi:hypothetical protein
MAEPIQVVCPKCARRWASNTDAVGTVETCPGCGGPTTVPKPTRIPTGPKDKCPACGSADTKPLGDKAIEKLYADYGMWKPPVLYRPRRCQACGCRWEVRLSRPAILFVMALLGVGLLFFAGAAGFLGWAVLAAEGDDKPLSQPIKTITGAVFVLFGLGSCGFGLRYYYHKFRAASDPRPAAGDPDG